MPDINGVYEHPESGALDAVTQRRIAEVVAYLTEINIRLPRNMDGQCTVHHIIETLGGYQCVTCGQQFALVEDE